MIAREQTAMPIDPARITHVRHTCAPTSRSAFRIAALFAAMLSLALATGQAGAQTGERRYQVEVVIFAQPAGSSVEHRPLQPTPPAGAELGPGSPGAPMGGAADSGDRGVLLPQGVSGPVAPRALEAVARRLNTGGYTLLWHQAWVQPAVRGDGLQLAALAALGQGPATPELSGTISLAAGRYLHLGLAIELHSTAGLQAELAQQRRVRTRVEQYFDHPHLGVITLVTPVTPDAEAEADQATP